MRRKHAKFRPGPFLAKKNKKNWGKRPVLLAYQIIVALAAIGGCTCSSRRSRNPLEFDSPGTSLPMTGMPDFKLILKFPVVLCPAPTGTNRRNTYGRVRILSHPNFWYQVPVLLKYSSTSLERYFSTSRYCGTLLGLALINVEGRCSYHPMEIPTGTMIGRSHATQFTSVMGDVPPPSSMHVVAEGSGTRGGMTTPVGA